MLVGSEWKLKYAGSVLGYAWSLAKPLALFSILYVVFGLLIRFQSVDHYPLFLLLGIVTYNFFSEATGAGMTSLVTRSSLIGKLSFPRIVIPLSATLTALLVFAVNVVAVLAFIAWNQIVPRLDWLFLLPLLGELFLFVFGLSLLLTALFVRFRDIGQIWELALQLLFFLTPILYPLQVVPAWGQKLILLLPLGQMIQDGRAVILYEDEILTIPGVFGGWEMRLVPFAIVLAIFGLGLAAFRRVEPGLAERL